MVPSLQNPADPRLAEAAVARVAAIAGPFGSGKTEIAVALASSLAARGARVDVADLDVVNPYFRTREARAWLEEVGARVLAPPPEMGFVDLPVLAPGVSEALAGDGRVVLDVGGDAAGARVLRLFAGPLRATPHDVLFVVNACRPYAQTAGLALAAIRSWEGVSGIPVTAVVSNAHLIEETTRETVLRGLAVARDAAARAGVRLAFAAVTASIAASVAPDLGVPVLPIERRMLPPHLRRAPCRR